ncbi:N-acetylmannosamine-6-phosphate 2-epimerase [Laedolimicola ammoniilytica]|uniref:Putative N-acetylmannosamine-6-phosphate 2-epimerase n=1 Tax=Laedolimicola ammoniilytica TaxID=2981771 RepID=A0ABT2S116_9FIRM|nr:N-acetylmannosamine-6-phosphate 2-epimerase [Laedolimicola ammoniilytica]MCU6698137.1 N-acetylmannosamine-6-phosphate 2-epimerase [Laedolimicola ammoniilytica]SCI64941.1 Putative N-acetylmannosamine-6-phosphate 2-epimerase [uncultured Clostridium sp.]
MKVEELKKGLIVSCQATSEEPMRNSDIMGRFAYAAQMGGAVGVRVNGIADILACKQMIHIPIIGIVKHVYEGYWSYITPTLRDVENVYETGAEIIAVDATKLPKPEGKTTEELLTSIKKEFPDVILMADVSTLEEGLAAVELGCDLVSTTLAGYTEYTRNDADPRIVELREPDIKLVKDLTERVKVPVIAEGRYWDDKLAIEAFKAGAHNVVIGAGITRPQIITKKIVDNIQEYL